MFEGYRSQESGARRKGIQSMTTTAKKFQDLIVWQKAHQFVLGVYEISKSFPADERYGLTSQFRRSVTSIPANIAEGFKKRGQADKARFFNIAQGSLEETRYYLILIKDLNYGETNVLVTQIEEVSKLLSAYYKKILTSVS